VCADNELREGTTFSAAARAQLAAAAAALPHAPPLAPRAVRLARAALSPPLPRGAAAPLDGADADDDATATLTRAIGALLFPDDGGGDSSSSHWRLRSRVVVRALPSSHAAAPGRGVFAAAAQPAHTPLLVYGGELVSDAEADDGAHAMLLDRYNTPNHFLMRLQPGLACDAGSTRRRCRAAYVNDARGSGAPPNCAFLEVQCGGGCLFRESDDDDGCGRDDDDDFCLAHPHPHAVLVTLRDVAQGEELTVSYGHAFWAAFSSRVVNDDATCDDAPAVPRGVAVAAMRPVRRPAPDASEAAGASAAAAAGGVVISRETHIDALPEQLLQRIFEALPVFDRASFARVRAAWRRVAAQPHLWRSVRLGAAATARSTSFDILWRLEAAAAHAQGGLHTLDLAPLGQRCRIRADVHDERDVRLFDGDAGWHARPFAHEPYDHAPRAPGLWGVLMRVARANAPSLREVRLTLNALPSEGDDDVDSWPAARLIPWESVKHAYAWRSGDAATARDGDGGGAEELPRSDSDSDSYSGAEDGDDDDDEAARRPVTRMWRPHVLASAAARLGDDVALTADVALATADDVTELLALHASGRVRLEALSLTYYDAAQGLGAEDGARLVSALSSDAHLCARLTHVSLCRSEFDEQLGADVDEVAAGEALVLGVLGALAAAAPRLHTLELFDVSPAALRAAAAALAGRPAFALARLDVLVADANKYAGAMAALAAALPASLRALSVDVRKQLSDAEPLLAAFVAAAAARCPRLRALRLAAHRNGLARHWVHAARRRLLAGLCAAAPRLRARFFVYGAPAHMSTNNYARQTARAKYAADVLM
jgi:hypothetical protein